MIADIFILVHVLFFHPVMCFLCMYFFMLVLSYVMLFYFVFECIVCSRVLVLDDVNQTPGSS